MTTSISAQLNQTHRNALLSYYLGQYVENNADLSPYIKTPEDVYEYLLIDPMVSNDVTTSQVAAAISSIQQYMNSMALNMEPDFNSSNIDNDQLQGWKNGNNQYAIWAGEMELQNYPEDYIDPTLRQNKTTYFQDLETILNQNKINSDTAQDAVLNYLNEFEQVANLDMVSGYLNGVDVTKDRYYLLGKTRGSSAKYFWRTFDMAENVSNVISVNAWSEWNEATLSINDDALVGTVRPTIFNNRLYAVWFERMVTGQTVSEDGTTVDDIITLTCNTSYLRFDNTWSAISVVGSREGNRSTSLLLSAEANDYFTMALCSNKTEQSESATGFFCLYVTVEDGIYQTFSVGVDAWFNPVLYEDTYVSPVCSVFGTADGQKLIQYTIPGDDEVIITSVSAVDSGDNFNGGILSYIDNISIGDMSLTKQTDNTYIISIPLKYSVDPCTYQFYKISGASGDITSSDISIEFCDNIAYLNGSVSIDLEDHADLSGVDMNIQDDRGVFYSDPVYQSDENIEYNSDNENYIFSNYPMEYKELKDKLWNSEVANLYFNYGGGHVSPNFYMDQPDKDPITWWAKAFVGDWGAENSPLAQKIIYAGTDEEYAVKIPGTIGITTFVYGIEREQQGGDPYSTIAWRSFNITVTSMDTILTPLLSEYTDSKLGTAVFLDFQSMTFSDGTPISPIRLNTLFAKELINKASTSIDALLSWDTQMTEEPALVADGEPAPMDFNGANGLYFWELFFHMPFLVGYRLNQEQQYDEALSWLNYIFDPTARGRDNDEPDYWSVRPLVEESSPESLADSLQNPVDPDALATADPMHYQKALFMAYVRNMIAAGDADYRLLTNDGLSQAKLRYSQAKNLLGPRPDVQLVNRWQPDTLDVIAGATDPQLSQLENTLADRLYAFPGKMATALQTDINPNFVLPLNTQLLNYWNVLDSRMYNLRHNLSIDGQPLNIPLYATPVNPTVLMQQSAQGGSLTSASAGLSATIPPYRFRRMLQSAYGAVSTLTQFGQTLLSFYERGDNASLQQMQAQQMVDISSFTISLQQQAIDALNADQTALEASKTIAVEASNHYSTLCTNGVSSSESQAMNLQTSASSLLTAAEPLIAVGAGMNMAPDIFGFSDGGSKWGGAAYASGLILQLTGQSQELVASRIQLSEEYRRRNEEWQFQADQADRQITNIDDQLAALAIRQQAAQTSLQQAQAQQANLQTTLNYLTSRFTQASLYNWLTGQLSALYYQAYDAVVSLCLSAEACWQYEMCDTVTRFIQPNTWNDTYHGLLVGESLQLNLHQMESSWLNRNQRRLELTKTLSLKSLINDDTTWNAFIAKGTLNFALNESLLDSDYPGHYQRQLKFVTVSLPTLLGPYQDVRATLTQTSSSTLLKADIEGVNHLNDSDTGSNTNIINNLRASQQVAVSSGLNDSGLFELSFSDERYLPFEGTGAVSAWQLSFPNPTSAEQSALLAALSDVIVQVHYTAVYGGSTFEQSVIASQP